MDLKNIILLLTTITQRNTVTITQSFSKAGEEWINVRCLPDTRTLELTFLQTNTVEHHTTIFEAAKVIDEQINTPVSS